MISQARGPGVAEVLAEEYFRQYGALTYKPTNGDNHGAFGVGRGHVLVPSPGVLLSGRAAAKDFLQGGRLVCWCYLLSVCVWA